jgi:hypothetical protein
MGLFDDPNLFVTQDETDEARKKRATIHGLMGASDAIRGAESFGDIYLGRRKAAPDSSDEAKALGDIAGQRITDKQTMLKQEIQKPEVERIKALMAPDSPETQFARQEAKARIESLKSSPMFAKNPQLIGAFDALAGRLDSMTGYQINKEVENSPLLKQMGQEGIGIYRALLAGQAMDAKNAGVGVPGFSIASGAKPTAKDSETIKEMVTSTKNASDVIDALSARIAADGTEILPTGAKREIDLLQTNLLMQMKELEKLGVLNGPDLTLMLKEVGDATSVKENLLPGAGKQIVTNLKNLKGLLSQKLQNAVSARGYIQEGTPGKGSGSFPRTVRKGTQSATVSNEKELQEAIAEGFQ